MKALMAAVICVGLIASPLANAKGGKGGGGSRPSYSGSTHTSSHGGHYVGGSGSSHKGGDYKNSSSGDRYGTHAGGK